MTSTFFQPSSNVGSYLGLKSKHCSGCYVGNSPWEYFGGSGDTRSLDYSVSGFSVQASIKRHWVDQP